MEYLKENFEHGFQFEVRGSSKLSVHQAYNINVLLDNSIIKFRINENGELNDNESQDIFPPSNTSDTDEKPA